MMAYGIVYMATAPSGKAYIGQTTTTLAERKRGKYNPAFTRALAKYGAAICWKVVAECHSQLSLDAAEIRHITLARAAGVVLYNVKSGGRGGKHAPETCAQIAATLTGRKLSPEHRANLSAAWKREKRPKTAEWRANHSAMLKGRKQSPETIVKRAAARKHYFARKRQRATGMLV